MKTLFEYELKIKSKVDVTEEIEPGRKTIITKEIDKPVKVIIKQPGRAELTESINIYQIAYSDGIRKGLLPKILISKIFRESKGILTDSELKDLEGVSKKIVDIQDEYEKIKDSTDSKDKEKVKELLSEFAAANQQLESLEEVNNSLFRNSVENIAAERQLMYNILFLSYIDIDGKIQPLVSGNTIEEKLESFDKIIEDESSDESKNLARLYDEILVINNEFLRLYLDGKISKDQFPDIRKNIENRSNKNDLSEHKEDEKVSAPPTKIEPPAELVLSS